MERVERKNTGEEEKESSFVATRCRTITTVSTFTIMEGTSTTGSSSTPPPGDSKKRRRVLGEVQVTVVDNNDRSHVAEKEEGVDEGRKAIMSNKTTSEIFNDQRVLKEQFNTASQQLIQRDLKLEEMQKFLDKKSSTVEKLLSEKGKLMEEVMQLTMEKKQMRTTLDEETDVRKMIQCDTQKLVADIKASYEGKLGQLKAEKHALFDKLQAYVHPEAKDEAERSECDTQKLVADIKASYEGKLGQLNAEKHALFDKLQEYVHQEAKDEAERSEVTGTVELLKSQLAEYQQKYDDAKENLCFQRQRVETLSTKLQEMDRNYGLCKVDVRVLTREKTSLEQRLSRKQEQLDELKNESESLAAERSDYDRKISELTNAVKGEELKAQEAVFRLEQSKHLLDETMEEKSRLQKTLADLNQELKSLGEKRSAFEALQAEVKVKDALFQQKENEIQQKDRKIDQVESTKVILKEALVTLDNQLKEFEVNYSAKFEELQVSETKRNELSSELSQLREDYQKAKAQLNEAISLKALTEQQLAKLVDIMGDRDSKEATSLNEVNQTNIALTQEIHRNLEEFVHVKYENIVLNKQIETNREEYDRKILELKKQHEAMIQSKEEILNQMMCTKEQQKKAIDFVIDSSKKKKFNFFNFKGDKDKDRTDTPIKKGVTLPRKLDAVTPVSIPSTSSSCTPRTAPKSATLPAFARQPSALVLSKCPEGVPDNDPHDRRRYEAIMNSEEGSEMFTFSDPNLSLDRAEADQVIERLEKAWQTCKNEITKK